MSESLNERERAEALVIFALIDADLKTLGFWSIALSLLSMGVWVAFPMVLWWVSGLWATVALLGLVERYLAFRLALDRQLFLQLGRGDMSHLTRLDAALAQTGLRSNASLDRPWTDRLHGTRSLVRRHLIVVVVQTLALLVSFCLYRFS